jgi:sucrose phosphorylase
MVYNFALPLLTLHAFYKGDARTLTRWAKTLETPSEETTFLNFLASHDGIGILAGKDFISDDDLNMIVNRVKHLGGFISYKNNKDDSQSPYELNINYLDALANPINPEGDNKLIASRFLASQAVMLALRGVPGIYFHSLVGSQNWLEGVEQTGHHRSINRQKLDYKQLVLDLRDQTSLRYQIFSRYKDLLEVRKSCSAFHPNGGQIALDLHPAVFSILRTSRDDKIKVICLHNVTPNQQNITIDLDVLNITSSASLTDLISKHTFSLEGKQISINFLPYQVSWLKIDN